MTIEIVSASLTVLVLVFLAWKEMRSGTSNLRSDINNDYKERNTQLEEKLRAVEEKLQIMSLQIAKLETTINEKDKHIDNLTKLIENRNPELVILLTEIKGFLANLQGLAVETKLTSENNQKELEYQTQILNRQNSRNKNIDSASSEHVGDPLRIKK